jgi:hypothetical protein
MREVDDEEIETISFILACSYMAPAPTFAFVGDYVALHSILYMLFGL